MATDTPTPSYPPVSHQDIRNKRLLQLALVFIMIIVIGCAYLFLRAPSRTTDDAYVSGHVVAVTPQVAGTVVKIYVDNTSQVKTGDPLVDLDATDAKVELAAAKAQLAQAVRNVRGLYANNKRYDAEIAQRQTELAKANTDLTHRQRIAKFGAVTGEEVRHAQDAVSLAQAALESTKQASAESLAQTMGSDISSHPAVEAAAARVRAAALALQRTHIVASVAGMIAQRTVQLGKRISPGDVLMSIVPLDTLWVDANFKEVQLQGICAGQSVSIVADLYGKSVTYHGTVVDLQAGTGAAFALLPPQNATGNWIKVVQRVPVRIQLDPKELVQHPLRIGLSVEASVDISKCNRKTVFARQIGDASTVYDTQAKAADTLVAEVIASNLGKH